MKAPQDPGRADRSHCHSHAPFTIGAQAMRKSLRCILGIHAWYAATTDGGNQYKACGRCNAAEELISITDASPGNAGTGSTGGAF